MTKIKTTNDKVNGTYRSAKVIASGKTVDTNHRSVSGRTVVTRKASGNLRIVYTPLSKPATGKSTKK